MPSDLRDWVRHVFYGPAVASTDRLLELDEFCGPDQITLERLTLVFENAPVLLGPCPDDSLDQAFWNLDGNVLFALDDESIDWDVRHRLILSFETLFRDLFAIRCTAALGHLDEESPPLNSICYMWWDLRRSFSVTPDPTSGARLNAAFLASMASMLKIDHVACQESGLHGLGHWHRSHPKEVENIIDEFLARKPGLRHELVTYALRARIGSVL